jgi:hypothetical protein
MIGRFDLGEDQSDFLGREDDRQFEFWIRPDQLDLGGPGTPQGFFPKELDRADGLSGRLAGNFLVALEEDEVLAQFLGGDLVGRFVAVLGELAVALPISLAGAAADGAEFEVVGEGD